MKKSRRDSYESFRLVVALRLLSFPVDAIAVVANIPAKLVRLILLEHGIIPVDRAGRFQWSKAYSVPPRRRVFLQLPPFVPKRSEFASRHIANAVIAARGSDTLTDLMPRAINAPERGYVSNWGPVAVRHRDIRLKRTRRARS